MTLLQRWLIPPQRAQSARTLSEISRDYAARTDALLRLGCSGIAE